MIIRRFRAKAIHGYLDFDIIFDRRLTFLTGINGSGKTTIVNSIVSLVAPSFPTLANLNFSSMTVEIEEGSKKTSISAERNKREILISISGIDQALTMPIFLADPDDIPRRIREQEEEFYQQFVAAHANHPVLKAISALPTPMFLDIDRRARAAQERGFTRVRFMRRGRNIFSASLTQSLLEAASLAEDQFKELLIGLSNLSDELRRDMVLSLLQMDASMGWAGPLQMPSQQELTAIAKMREHAKWLPQILGIQEKQVEKRIFPFLDKLEEFAHAIPQKAKLDDLLSGDSRSKEFDAVIRWSANVPQFKKLRAIIDKVEKYNSVRDQTSATNNRFLDLTNKFLGDSGKVLAFDKAGNLTVELKNLVGAPQSIVSLSSGEAQIIVILTHLFFNPAAQKANVFIIDEPELSLHVHWQELFVESVMSANPNVQFIMATHAPAIILDRLDHCRDLNARIKG